MRLGAPSLCLLLLGAGAAQSQNLIAERLDLINLRPPAIGNDGQLVLFAAKIRPDARADSGTNLYRWVQRASSPLVERLTNVVSDAVYAGVTSIAYPGSGDVAAYTALAADGTGSEEVHIFNLLNQTDRTVPVDTTDCVRILCVDCFRSCVTAVHLADSGTMALYAITKSNNPFRTVTADGTNDTELPVYQGALAPSPQRVITSGGRVVFTSAAPFGPTFAAAATDVYLMDLDGTNIQAVTQFGDSDFAASNAVISRDGSWIAFESNYSGQGEPGTQQIWIVRSDGSGLRQISFGEGPATSPSISSDGGTVAYIQDGQVNRMNTGVDPVALLPPPELTNLTVSTPHEVAISGDGRFVVFSLGSINGTSAAVYRIPTAPTPFRDFTEIYAPRIVFANGVVSAAGTAKPSPGGLITVYGANLSRDEFAVAREFPLPEVLGQVSLQVNGAAAPLLAATPWQINAHLPQSVLPGNAAFKVTYDDGVSLPLMNSAVAAVAPEIFLMPSSGGEPQAAAVHVGTTVLVDAANPALPGEIIEIYGTGFGVTSPMVDAGVASPSVPAPATAVQPPRLRIGGVEAAGLFSGLTPGLAGVYQMNVPVPESLSAGVQRLTFVLPDGTQSGSTTIVVRAR